MNETAEPFRREAPGELYGEYHGKIVQWMTARRSSARFADVATTQGI